MKAVPSLTVVYSGVLIADMVIYYFGKRYGRRIFTHKRFRRLLPPERFERIEEQFRKRGSLFILFGRHLAGLRVQIFLVAGIMRMPALKFLIADAVSSLFTIALMTGLGFAGGNSLQIIREDISRVEHAVVFGLIIAFVIYLFFRYFRSVKKSL